MVTNGQIPHWLNLDNERIKLITHDEIFKFKTDLPTFSSAAIESNLHRIPGLSENFLYLNDDILLNQPVSIHDFYDPLDGWRIYLAWDVPQCAPDCPNNWIQDGYCDKLCNNAACEFDGGDCVRSDAGIFEGEPDSSWNDNDGIAQLIQTNSKITQCSKDCLVSWLGDKFCDHSCNNKPCAFDMGDCGVSEYTSRIHELIVNEKVTSLILPKSENIFFINLTDFNFISGDVSSPNVPILSIYQHEFKVLTVMIDKNVTAEEINIEANLESDGNKNVTFTIIRSNIADEIETNLNLSKIQRGELEAELSDPSWIDSQYLAPGISPNGRKILATEVKPKYKLNLGQFQRPDTFAESLKYVNKLYNGIFGHVKRKVIAHMPHFINSKIMDELQSSFSDEFRKTSSNQIRTVILSACLDSILHCWL